MPEVPVLNLAGEEVGRLELAEELFGVTPNLDLMHQAVLYAENRLHPDRGMTKTRSEIRATGAKWGRQKGLGRARHGARSAPLFVGGAKAHSPRGVRRQLRMPKKMRRRALACALSAQHAKGLLRFVEDLRPENRGTKQMAEALENLRCSQGKTLAVVGDAEYYDELLQTSSRNLPNFILRAAPHFNTRDVLLADHIIMSREALSVMSSGGDSDAD
jgi:large subunit ribosomal protein L4